MKTIIKSITKDKNKYLIELKDNPFRIASGGQPSDKGIIIGPNFKLKVIDVKKNNILITEKIAGEPSKTEIEANIDVETRKKLTRMHSGEHVLFKSIEKIEPSLKLDKIKLDQSESTIIVYADSLNWNKLFKAEDLANKIISENKNIKTHLVKKEEAKNIKNLRIKIDRIKSNQIKIIEIEDFDHSACSGTHCKNTKEIGPLLITHFKSAGKNHYEIKFKLDIKKELYEMSRIIRLISNMLGCEKEKIISTIENLKNEQEILKKIIRKQKLEFNNEKIKDKTLYYINLENYDQKILIEQGNKLANKEKCLISIFNETKKGLQLILISTIKKSAKEILSKLNKKYNIKGGGKDNFAMSIINNTSYKIILNELKEILKNEN